MFPGSWANQCRLRRTTSTTCTTATRTSTASTPTTCHRSSPHRGERMPSQDDEAQIWFLTGSQALHGEETLRQGQEQPRRIAETLAGQLGVRLVWRPVLTTADAIRRTCLEATASDECIGVVAWMHTFSPAKMWIGGLEALRKPLLHLHTQANVSLPWSQIDMDFMNLNQAAHGDREFGHIQSRLGVARKIVAGHVSDPVVAGRVEAWTRAARGWQAAQSLRSAWIGGIMRNVAVTEGDKVEAERVFGFSVNTWGVKDPVPGVDAGPHAEVDALVDEYDAAYDVVPELRKDGDRRESLRYAARQELGLRSFLDDGAGDPGAVG